MPPAFGTKRSYQLTQILEALQPQERIRYLELGRKISEAMLLLEDLRYQRECLYQRAVARIRNSPERREAARLRRKLEREKAKARVDASV